MGRVYHVCACARTNTVFAKDGIIAGIVKIYLLRYAVVFGIIASVLVWFPADIHAAKARVRKPAARGSTGAGVAYSSARLSRGSHSVVVTFLNLGKVSRIEYALSYAANGIPQGVLGSFTPGGQATDSRDLYFGTCSKGVCTPHYGISNASLVVTTTLKSGASNTKRYRIKSI